VQKNQNIGSVTPPALPYRLDGKVALITGAGRGIGAEMALQLARCGAKVLVNYVRSTQSAEKLYKKSRVLAPIPLPSRPM
jgi:tetrahydroxynaphthalene reductase